MKKVLFICLFIGSSMWCKSQMISCAQAAAYMGSTVTVCGEVKSAMRDTLGKKAGTLLAMCLPYPHQPLMVVIKDETLPLFPYNAATWPGKQICVTGTIELLGGRPYISVRKRNQIVVD